MKRFVQGEDGSQSTLFPESLEDYISEDNPVRADAAVDRIGRSRAGEVQNGCRFHRMGKR